MKIAQLSAITAIAFAGIACFAAGNVQAKVTTVTFSLVCGSDEIPGWKGIVDAFNKQSADIKVKLEILPGGWTEYVQKMLLQAAAGTSPDIGRMGVAYMPHFKKKNLLTNLMPYMKQDRYDQSLYYKAAFKGLVQGNVVYGLPAGIYSMATYYNRTAFQQAGLSFPSPNWTKTWTWDEFRNAAKKLTKKGATGKPSQYGYSIDFHPERSLQWIWQNGGDFFNANRTRCTIDSPGSVGALRFLHEMIWKDQSTGVGLDFIGGKTAIWQEGTWCMPSMLKVKKFAVGLAPMPRGREGSVTEIYVDPYVIFNGSKHKKEAWKVIKFFTEKEAENVLVDNQLMGVPVLKSVASSRHKDMFKALVPEEKQVWFDSVDYSRDVPFTTNWLDMMSAYTARIDKLVRNTGTVEDTAKAITQDINKLLARAK